MQIQKKDEIYIVSGVIDESCNLDNFNLPSGKVKFDLSGLKTFNSVGIRDWISGLNKLKIIQTYINCSHGFVLLLNMVKEFIANDAVIESFQIPAYCNICEENKIIIARAGYEFFPSKVFSYKLPKCEIDGSDLEPMSDFDADYYFIELLKP